MTATAYPPPTFCNYIITHKVSPLLLSSNIAQLNNMHKSSPAVYITKLQSHSLAPTVNTWLTSLKDFDCISVTIWQYIVMLYQFIHLRVLGINTPHIPVLLAIIRIGYIAKRLPFIFLYLLGVTVTFDYMVSLFKTNRMTFVAAIPTQYWQRESLAT